MKTMIVALALLLGTTSISFADNIDCTLTVQIPSQQGVYGRYIPGKMYLNGHVVYYTGDSIRMDGYGIAGNYSAPFVWLKDLCYELHHPQPERRFPRF